MRVVLIAPGPVDHAIACANGLAPHAEVTLIAPARLYAGLERWLDPRITLRLIGWPRTRSPRNLAMLGRVMGLVRRARPDVIHVLSNTTVWLNAIAPLLRRQAPLITTVHDVTPHPGDRETLQLPDWTARLMARQSGDLVVHGAGLRAAAARRFDKPPSRVHVLPHPAITRYAEAACDMRPTPPAPGLRVLLFGRMFAYKGVDDLLRAESLLGDRIPGLQLVLAGRGDDPNDLSALMGDPGRYRIHHGFIADDHASRLFLDCDVVVLPYAEASQSGVLMIAATFGKPVIVTDVGELGSTVRAAGAGLVVPPRDPAALADAMALLHDDSALRDRLGKGAAAWADGPVRPDHVGARMVALYALIRQRRDPLGRTDAPRIRQPD
ncbi:glycosyltransferase family 4 protein [Paracoccus sediminilitoris]|uniref:glycosyltransferase family 4 protein n=1 Tax=Paracoccus sediminilitoris TaxID=2202419 RepID=UPI00272B8DFE|nr:glycosyltransferase family 4 protein [Paracoccus sediminilitoris]